MKFQPIPTNNPKITLTELRQTDLKHLPALLNDSVVYKNTLTIPEDYKLSDAETYFEHVLKFQELNGCQKDWVIRENGKLIGGIGLLFNHGFDSHKSECGYWISAGHRGKGIMQSCVNAFVKYVFTNTEIVRIEGQVFTYNPASCRVLEKSGFEREGLLRKAFKKDGICHDVYLYAITK